MIPTITRWCVDYAEGVTAAAVDGYDLVVLDPAVRLDPSVLPSLTAGYLNLCEVDEGAAYHAAARAAGLLAGRADWPGAWRAALGPAWTAFVLARVLPVVTGRGFGAVFLDTADTGLDEGQGDAVIALISAIHARASALPLVLNRGFAVVPSLAGVVAAVVGEQIAPDEVPLLKRAQTLGMAALTLDYARRPASRARLYALRRREGFAPYVAASLALDSVTPEPRRGHAPPK